MTTQILCFLCLAVSVFLVVLLRRRRKSKLAAMTDADLLQESYWAAQSGDYDNVYGRELARRQAAGSRKTEVDPESTVVHQV
jgi:hypothetical protein